MEEVATDFYVNLIGKAQPRQHDISLGSLGLPTADLARLDAQFSEDKVWAAAKSLPADKSPGPDGFSWSFFQTCWPTVKHDVLAAIHVVYVGHDLFFQGLNSTFITLIPKKDDAADVKDYRPIILVHSFAKLFAKLLANRLPPIMSALVDKSQSAFIKGRCIQDNFVLVQQAALALHRRRIPTLLLKLDVAKAFDSVAWLFLASVLRQRGFGDRWIRWISLLLCFATTRVLVNGCIGPAFLHARGLWQGDPLSLLLFVLVMDVFARMFHQAEDEVAPALACQVVDFPCSYLGLPLSLTRLHKKDLQLVLDKLANKLAIWKTRLLNMEGRVAYVQIVMTASFIYQLLALDLEPWFLQAVDRLRRASFGLVGKTPVVVAASSLGTKCASQGAWEALGFTTSGF
ncbi:hypothetical protein ACQ4PT_048958 [Festuca glaucescens]